MVKRDYQMKVSTCSDVWSEYPIIFFFAMCKDAQNVSIGVFPKHHRPVYGHFSL